MTICVNKQSISLFHSSLPSDVLPTAHVRVETGGRVQQTARDEIGAVVMMVGIVSLSSLAQDCADNVRISVWVWLARQVDGIQVVWLAERIGGRCEHRDSVIHDVAGRVVQSGAGDLHRAGPRFRREGVVFERGESRDPVNSVGVVSWIILVVVVYVLSHLVPVYFVPPATLHENGDYDDGDEQYC